MNTRSGSISLRAATKSAISSFVPVSGVQQVSRRFSDIAACARYFSTARKYSESTKTLDTDIAIVGGGVVGASLAMKLQQLSPPPRITLVEASRGPMLSSTSNNNSPKFPFPRSYALSPASLELLQFPLGYPRVGYYQSMQVWEEGQPASLIFTTDDLQHKKHGLGAIVEDSVIVQHLWKVLSESPSLTTIHRNATVTDLQLPDSNNDGTVRMNLNEQKDGATTVTPLEARLVIAADGAASGLRKQAGIATTGFSYESQHAFTCTVELNSSHQGRAFQRFLASGPIALLPTFSDRHGIVVWSTSPEEAAVWKTRDGLEIRLNELLQTGPERLEPFQNPFPNSALSKNIIYGIEKLVQTVQYGPAMASQEFSGPFLAPPTIKSVVSDRFTFPLSCQQTTSYIGPRLALVGDAGHTVHPLAGQGLNLGLQDVADLVQVIQKAVDSGMDIATFLPEYESNRKQQVSLAISGIHALREIFGNNNPVGKHIKSVGMNLVQNIPPIRRRLVDIACNGI